MSLRQQIARPAVALGMLVALAMPEVRIKRQVRLIFRKSGERSHASAAFLAMLEEKKKPA